MTKEEFREKIGEIIGDVIFETIKAYRSHKINKFSRYEVADQILTLIRESGVFMDLEMVKGLMFEAQAKKCDQCPKNKD